MIEWLQNMSIEELKAWLAIGFAAGSMIVLWFVVNSTPTSFYDRK